MYVVLDDASEGTLGDPVLLRGEVSDSGIGKIEKSLGKEVVFEDRDVESEDLSLAEGNDALAGREMSTVTGLLVLLPAGRLGFE